MKQNVCWREWGMRTKNKGRTAKQNEIKILSIIYIIILTKACIWGFSPIFSSARASKLCCKLFIIHCWLCSVNETRRVCYVTLFVFVLSPQKIMKYTVLCGLWIQKIQNTKYIVEYEKFWARNKRFIMLN